MRSLGCSTYVLLVGKRLRNWLFVESVVQVCFQNNPIGVSHGFGATTGADARRLMSRSRTLGLDGVLG